MRGTVNSRVRRATMAAATVFVLAILGASSASAASDIYEFGNAPSTTEAGGHPDIVTSLEIENHYHYEGELPFCKCHDPKNIVVHSPAGVVANPHVVSECTPDQLVGYECPADSQVGIAVLNLENASIGWITVPMYKTVPQEGQAGLFAFSIPLSPVVAIPQYLSVSSRTGGDYGLDFNFEGLNHALPPLATFTEFWGVPGAAKNDILRFKPKENALLCNGNPLKLLVQGIVPVSCTAQTIVETKYGPQPQVGPKKSIPSTLPIAPFTQNPTTCIGPMSSTVEVTFYDRTTSKAETPWPGTTGCDKLSFNPSLAASPTTTETDSASGLAVDLKVPQFQSPNTPSPSEIRGQTIVLPEGFSINSGAADGKTTCSDAQANLTTDAIAECPDFSKIGTTELSSSALPGPIYGYIYLGEPRPNDRWRIIVTASGYGTNVKLRGSAHLDPVTGQVVTTFENLPQTPFQEFNLHYFGSERGLFATAPQCGSYPVKSTFEAWAAELAKQSSTQFFSLTSGPEGRPCPNGPRPFQPSLQGGVEDNTAGVHSPMRFELRRQDGEQDLSGVTASLPPGLLATLKGVGECPESAISALQGPGVSGLAEQASPSCPANSLIGTAIAGAGAGTHPVYLNGKVYLAGPYKGAPLSLLVSVPAVSGPYDLGDVAVRVALDVDPTTAQVTAVSDPLPQIVEGVPLRTRMIRISLDRPNFTVNPTNCKRFSVGSTSVGAEGASASSSVPFQIANCTDLGFAPKLALTLSGSTKRGGNPALRAILTTGSGDANLSRAVVRLPHSELLDQGNINKTCGRPQLAAGSCPASSVYGYARAFSPLLEKPLEGPVYLATGFGHNLPDLVADLNGQIRILLDGRIDSVKGGLRATFATVPDAPISKFVLNMKGGRKSLIENGPGVCAAASKAHISMAAQNGLESHRQVSLNTSCGKAGRKGHPGRQSRRPNSRRSEGAVR